MTPEDSSVERLVAHLETTSRRLPSEPPLLPALEAGYETLYALTAQQPELLRSTATRLRGLSGGPAGAAWLGLLELRSVSNGGAEQARTAVVRAVSSAPMYTALLVGAELARIVQDESGPAPAFRVANELALPARLTALGRPSDVQLDGPMLGPTCGLLLSLAARNGDFALVETVEQAARRLWPPDAPSLLRLDLACAEADLARGEYARALARIERTRPALPEADRLRAWYLELHALVALGDGDSDAAQTALERCLGLLERERSGHEVEELRDRIRGLAESNRKLSAIAEDAFPAPQEPPATLSTRELLRREASARRVRQPSQRRKLLSSLVERAEQRLEAPGIVAPEEELRLRLLWCRLVVELDLTQMFDFCESILASALARSRALGVRPLEMLAHDQLALIGARRSEDLASALVHSSAAVEIALELLAKNAAPGKRYRRSYLEDLLPVLDRAVELHARTAVRIATSPELAARPVDPFDGTLFENDSAQGAWQRYGRRLHAFAEHVQTLALNEARSARQRDPDDVLLAPPTLGADSTALLDDLRAKLRKQDVVLQYLLVGRYVLVFAYGRSFFHWQLGQAIDQTAEQSVEMLSRDLGRWIQGEVDPGAADALADINELLIPRDLVRTLALARVTHVRVVPHGALYRLPFGRLGTEQGRLGASFSLSLHPTGAEAARSAQARGERSRAPVRLAHVIGPELGRGHAETSGNTAVASGASDRERIELGLGRFVPPARVSSVDGFRSELSEVTGVLSKHELLHFICHGQKGSALGAAANLLVAKGARGELSTHGVAELPLTRCELVVLQSCWTGWMDHTRTHPVQGLPLAFCDAGAQAVIAPLTQVPMALAPVFSEVFYRALRFLPAERALARALSVLRAKGGALVRRNAETAAAFRDWGSTFDDLEYRYTGSSHVVFGNWLSRLAGRLGFWWFERKLAKQG